MTDVGKFEGEYRFLSNFWLVDVIGPGNKVYASVEHAYQASKSLNPDDWRKIQACATPSQAKKLGKSLDIRPDWDTIKIDVMRELLLHKFKPDSELANQLKKIDGQIEEGNWWGDEFWGVNLKTNKGRNCLGKLLMKIRDELISLERWTTNPNHD